MLHHPLVFRSILKKKINNTCIDDIQDIGGHSKKYVILIWHFYDPTNVTFDIKNSWKESVFSSLIMLPQTWLFFFQKLQNQSLKQNKNVLVTFCLNPPAPHIVTYYWNVHLYEKWATLLGHIENKCGFRGSM